MATAQETKSHDEIRAWAEARGGRPAVVRGTELLRIDFGEPEEELQEVSWEKFFEVFDSSGLLFLHDPDPESRFNKFVNDEGAARGRGAN